MVFPIRTPREKMATYYPSSSNQRDVIPTLYLRDPASASYPEAPVHPGNMTMYLNFSSSAGSYSDTLAGNSQLQHERVELTSVGMSDSTPSQQGILSNLVDSQIGEQAYSVWRDGRNEMLFIQPMGGPTSMQSIGEQMNSATDDLVRSSVTGDPSPGLTSTVPKSKYLRAAQQLLDEIVNIQKALKQNESDKNQSFQGFGLKVSKETDCRSKDGGALPPTTGMPSNPQESSTNPTGELSPAERQDLQDKMTKLLSMLDEFMEMSAIPLLISPGDWTIRECYKKKVDRRYKQYYYQMQIVVSSFDVIAGRGAAKPYTALALQTISRHFRCLRDAISGQVKANRRSLGEQDTAGNSKGGGISRLRFVDQQLKQQRALQQLGMMQQHAWRPQRGLPESSVSILRAWLFEHFLHPYPTDSDKIMLARQTSLTRSQVSNWFINARVRLWKPMVEEIYKEEIGDTEMDSNSSSDNTPKAARDDIRVSKDMGEELQQNMKSATTEKCHPGQFHESKSDLFHDVEMSGTTAGASFQNGTHGEDDTDYGGMKLMGDERPNADNCSLLQDALIHSNGSDNRRFMTAAASYQMTELGRFGSGGGVSLTLGLQHCDNGDLTHHNFVSMVGEERYNSAASSVGPDTADYDCMDPSNQRQRFSSSHLLHDFVA